MSASETRISCEIDFEEDGKQTGYLRLPHSVHRSAYGWLAFPVICIRNGDGPTAYLQSGTHGDEYEGQVTHIKLAREMEAKDIRGRIIVFPTANAPAARAGMRTSPIDEGNLNRMFPGDPGGSPTEMIAHYIETVFLPMADYVFDLHSGGSSLMMTPFAEIKETGDAEKNKVTRGVLEAFGCPISLLSDVVDDRTMAAATLRHGGVYLGTELGGGGTVTPAALAHGEQGMRRALKHIGILRDDYPVEDAGEIRYMQVGGAEYFVFSPDDGLLEPYVDIGAEVKTGQPAGAIHFPETPWREPSLVHFQIDGLVVMKRMPGRSERGDCLFHLATDATV